MSFPQPLIKKALAAPLAAALLAVLYMLYQVVQFFIGGQAEKINDIHVKAQAIPEIREDHANMREFFQTFVEVQESKETEQTQAIIQSCKVAAKAFRQNPDDCIPTK